MANSIAELRAIFCDALECKSPTERDRFLDQVCNDKPELRSEIETLLAAHAEANGLAHEDTCEAENTRDKPNSSPAGATI